MSNIEVVGSFYVDENPAKNAKIIINGKEFSTDRNGQFDALVKAEKRGNYSLNVVGIYDNVKVSKEISVVVT